MTDDADRSDEKIAAAIDTALQRVRQQPTIPFTGECYFCAEELTEPKRFCDTFCRDDWDAEQLAKRRQGR